MSLPESRAFCPKNYIISAAGGGEGRPTTSPRVPDSYPYVGGEIEAAKLMKIVSDHCNSNSVTKVLIQHITSLGISTICLHLVRRQSPELHKVKI